MLANKKEFINLNLEILIHPFIKSKIMTEEQKIKIRELNN